MNWIILIGNGNFSLEDIKSVVHCDAKRTYDSPEFGHRFCVDYGEDYVFYDHINAIQAEYTKGKLACIPFSSLNFVMMIYRKYDRMKSILLLKDFPTGIYVDNDHELIVPIEQFRAMGMPVDWPPYPPVRL